MTCTCNHLHEQFYKMFVTVTFFSECQGWRTPHELGAYGDYVDKAFSHWLSSHLQSGIVNKWREHHRMKINPE